MTMKLALVLSLLCSGFPYLTFALNRLRVVNLTDDDDAIFDSSKKECATKNSTLVTLYDEDDANILCNMKNVLEGVWLGLTKKTRKNVTTWSDGAPVTYKPLAANVQNGEQTCGAIENNTLKHFNCSERKPFMCYKDKRYTLIKHEKNWCQALQYCRKYYTDLVSIRDEKQEQEVMKKGGKTSFWTGLLNDEWEWLDTGCSTFRNWHNGEPEVCTVSPHSCDDVSLYPFDCENGGRGFCSKGYVRIKVIDEDLTWEQAFDYCEANHTGPLRIENKEDQTAVEQWLNYTKVGGPFWIGMRQSRVFGFWLWSNMTVVYSHWKDNKQPEPPLSNHCGAIYKNGSWSDENCLQQLPFLCEEEIFFMQK